MIRQALLLSSGKTPTDLVRLHHAEQNIRDFLQAQGGAITSITLVPFAGIMPGDEYVRAVGPSFEALGLRVKSVHEGDPIEIIRRAEAICVGGGNTNELMRQLHATGLCNEIRKRVLQDGIPYLGWSAGSNVAFGGMETTNDMNAPLNTNFQGLGLIEGGLRMNAHYVDALRLEDLSPEAQAAANDLMRLAPETVPILKPQGESRADRLVEYLKVQPGPIIGLYEGGILRVDGMKMTLMGTAGAKLFRRGQEPERYAPGADLSFLLET